MEEEMNGLLDFPVVRNTMDGIIKVIGVGGGGCNAVRNMYNEGVDHLVNPLDNAINEKCSRIKKVFLDMMDEYTACYYIISGHTKKHLGGRVWYERLKTITLPRELVELRIKS